MTEDHIEILKNGLKEEQKERLIEKGKVASAWIYKIIKKLYRGKNVVINIAIYDIIEHFLEEIGLILD